MPSVAARSPRSWIFLPCLTRRSSIAFSTSPSASVRAFLQSIIPAPVRSRRALTSLAEISVVLISAPPRRLLGGLRVLGCGLGDGDRLRGASAALAARLCGRAAASAALGDRLGGRRGRLGRLARVRRRAHRRDRLAARLERRRVGRRLRPAGSRRRAAAAAAAAAARSAAALSSASSWPAPRPRAWPVPRPRAWRALRPRPGFLLGLLARAFLLGAEHRVALGDDLADRLRDQRAGADRVVVAGDDEVDPVGVAVGVDEADDRDAQALRLFDRDHLGLEVDHEHRVGDALHVLDAAEVRAQLREVGLGGHPLARRQQRELALGLVAFEVVQAADALVDRLEVRQQAAQPAVVDVGHVRRLGDVLDRVAGLLLGADEQDGAAAVGERARELLGLREQGLRLEQVDDVDAAALAEDEAAHLGVPAARLVAEVNAGLQQLRDADVGHGLLPCFRFAVVPCAESRTRSRAMCARSGQGRDPCSHGSKVRMEPLRISDHRLAGGARALQRASGPPAAASAPRGARP